MKRKTFPLCTLLLVASLSACAPAVQTAQGTYQPNTVVGLAYVLATRVRADQITDQTPNDVYATFDDCVQAAVAVGDVRRLGVDVADSACRATRSNANAVVITLGAVALAFSALLIYLLSHVFSHTSAAPQTGTP